MGLGIPEVSSAQVLISHWDLHVLEQCQLCALRLTFAVIIKHYGTSEVHEYTTGKGRIYVGFVVENVELVLSSHPNSSVFPTSLRFHHLSILLHSFFVSSVADAIPSQ